MKVDGVHQPPSALSHPQPAPFGALKGPRADANTTIPQHKPRRRHGDREDGSSKNSAQPHLSQGGTYPGTGLGGTQTNAATSVAIQHSPIADISTLPVHPILARFSRRPPRGSRQQAQEWFRQGLEQVPLSQLKPDDHTVGLECLQCKRVERYRLHKEPTELEDTPSQDKHADLERLLNGFKVRCDSCPKPTNGEQEAKKKARGLFYPANATSVANTNAVADLQATGRAASDRVRRGKDNMSKSAIPMDTVGKQVEAIDIYANAVFVSDEPLQSLASSTKFIDGVQHRLQKLRWNQQDKAYSFSKHGKHIFDELVRSRMDGPSADAVENKKMVNSNEFIWVADHFPAMDYAAQHPQIKSTEITRYGSITTELRPAFIDARNDETFEVHLSYTFGGKPLSEAVASDQLNDYMRLVEVEERNADILRAVTGHSNLLFVKGCNGQFAGRTSYLKVVSVALPYHAPMKPLKGFMLPISEHVSKTRVHAACTYREETWSKKIEAALAQSGDTISQEEHDESLAFSVDQYRKGRTLSSPLKALLISTAHLHHPQTSTLDPRASAPSIVIPSTQNTAASIETAQLKSGQNILLDNILEGQNVNGASYSLKDDLFGTEHQYEGQQDFVVQEPGPAVPHIPAGEHSKQNSIRNTITGIDSAFYRVAFAPVGTKRGRAEDEVGDGSEECQAKISKCTSEQAQESI